MLNEKFIKINSYGLDEVVEENEESTISEAVIFPLDVTPSTSAQTIDAPEGIDGYNPIRVSAVTSSIDSNIKSSNIRQGVSILGVTGSLSGIGIMKSVDSNGVLQEGTTIIDLSGVLDIGDSVLSNAYKNNNYITGRIVFGTPTISGNYACDSIFQGANYITHADFSRINQVTGTYSCANIISYSSSLEEVDLSGLKIVTGENAFYYACASCQNLETVHIDNLALISGFQAFPFVFNGTQKLIEVEFKSLETINGQQAFRDVFAQSNIEVIRFPSLSRVSGYHMTQGMCWRSSNITDIYFNSLMDDSFSEGDDTIFYQMLSMAENPTGTITLHFSESLSEDVLSQQLQYPNFESHINVDILFDLPRVVKITDYNGNEYLRKPWLDSAGNYTAWGIRGEFYNTYYIAGNLDSIDQNSIIYADPELTIEEESVYVIEEV